MTLSQFPPVCDYCAHCDADLTVDTLWEVPGVPAVFCYACAKDLARAVSHGHVTLADLTSTYSEEDSATVTDKPLTASSANDSLSRTRNP